MCPTPLNNEAPRAQERLPRLHERKDTHHSSEAAHETPKTNRTHAQQTHNFLRLDKKVGICDSIQRTRAGQPAGILCQSRPRNGAAGRDGNPERQNGFGALLAGDIPWPG